MNSDQLEGQWKQVKGKVKEKWGKLTDSDLDVIAGKRDQFLGKLQERYGYTREQAERDLSDWERTQKQIPEPGPLNGLGGLPRAARQSLSAA